MNYVKQIAYVLILIGALNWGLYGVAEFDLVAILFGKIPMIARIVYTLVGLSAAYIIIYRYKICLCKKDCSDCCDTCIH